MTRVRTLLVFLSAGLSVCAGQQAGVGFSRLSSDNKHLERANVLNAFAGVPVAAHIDLTVSYSRGLNTATYAGMTGDAWGFRTVAEPIRSSAALSSLDLTIRYGILDLDPFLFMLGSSVGVISLDTEQRGTVTGRTVPTRGARKLSYGFSASACAQEFVLPAMSILLTVQKSFLERSPSATDMDNPFSDPLSFLAMRVEVAYLFPP